MSNEQSAKSLPRWYEPAGKGHPVRLVGWSAGHWLKRLDVESGELPTCQAMLISNEPHRNAANSLAERMDYPAPVDIPVICLS